MKNLTTISSLISKMNSDQPLSQSQDPSKQNLIRILSQKQELQELQDQKKRPIDFGFCVPDCPICGGLGMIPRSSEDLPISHPDFGKLDVCPNRLKAFWPKDLGIEEEEAHYLKLTRLHKTELVNISADYIRHLFNDRSGMMYIYGSVGTGKTVLIKAVLLWAVFKYRIFPGHYTTHALMMDRLRSSFGDKYNSNQYGENIKYYSELPILAIDEIGRDKDSEFSLASFGKILDRRYTLGKYGKAITLFSSNFKPRDILEPYMTDRLEDVSNFVISVKADSLRRKDLKLEFHKDWWKEVEHE